MKAPRLHNDATARTLAAARVFVFAMWFVKLLLHDIQPLGYLSNELFHPFGILGFLPLGAVALLTSPFVLIGLKAITLVLVVSVMFGVGKNRLALLAAAIMLTLYFGLAKGFGGHVNHRELVLLYVTYLLVLFPCFSVLAIKPSADESTTTDCYSACMQMICGVILLNYFFVGAARLFVGFPEVFDPEVMYNWVFSRNVRPNPYHGQLGLWLLSSTWGRFALASALPVSTIVELAAPFALWSGNTVRRLLIVMLAAFHVGIFLVMNIVFIENIALLVLLCNYTSGLDRLFSRRSIPSSSSGMLAGEIR